MSRRSRNLLKISQIAKQAGVLTSTIRFYTDIGLLHVSGETPGGHRLYDVESTLNTIRRIQFLSRKGLVMEDIKKELIQSEGKKKILVIDDEPEVGNLVKEVISSFFPDIEIRIVLDGFSAGRILSEYLPDLIILDLMLPGINGFEVCKQIRSTTFLSGIKILAVTAYDNIENKKKILSCGADDYLAKPMDISSLKEKVNSILDVSPVKPKVMAE